MTYLSPYPPGCTAKDIDDAYGPDEEDTEEQEEQPIDFFDDDFYYYARSAFT
jgi:hypothetical protein